MKFPGRLYKGKSGTYLALYNHYSDVWIACPDSLEEKAERMGHVVYRWGRHQRAIDIFRINEEVKEIPEIKLTHTITPSEIDVSDVDRRQGVEYEIMPELPSDILDLARKDIREFIQTKKGNPEAKVNTTAIVKRDALQPTTAIKYIEYPFGRIITPGKSEFTKQCGNHANTDYGQGCVTALVNNGKGFFDLTEGVVREVTVAPWHECSYCYAQPKHESVLKTVFKFDREQFKEELLGKAKLVTGSDEEHGRPIQRLRFGKRTEAASLFTRPQFIQSLEVCAEVGTQGVIPTKFLEYDPDVAELLRRTSSVILYSIGWDKYQRGAVSWGCTTEWELEQAAKYGEAGVNAAIYLMVANPVAEPGTREKEIIAFTEKHKRHLAGTQILPMRYKSIALARDMGDIHWHDAKSKRLLLATQDKDIGCFQVLAGELNPKEFNKYWLDLIADNNGFYRMCHHTNEHVWCGGCFTRDGLSINHKRSSVRAVKRKPRPPERKKKKDKKIPAIKENQLELFEE